MIEVKMGERLKAKVLKNVNSIRTACQLFGKTGDRKYLDEAEKFQNRLFDSIGMHEFVNKEVKVKK